MCSSLVAHVQRPPDGPERRQTLQAHSHNVAQLCAQACRPLGLEKLGLLTGWLHDVGKSHPDIQTHLLQGTSQKINHSSAGMRWLWETCSRRGRQHQAMAQLACLAIGCHHSGRCDYIAPDGSQPWLERMESDQARALYDGSVQAFFSQCCEEQAMESLADEAAQEVAALKVRIKNSIPFDYRLKSQNEAYWVTFRFWMGLVQRFLFSALVDADWTDTACFMGGIPLPREDSPEQRQAAWDRLSSRTESYLRGLPVRCGIDGLRREISDQCFSAAQSRAPGIYRLYVPTGGGKTYAGLRFCVEMARRHNVPHIFYFAPYKSITQQNAACIRNVLGDANVLEHHSDILLEEDGEDTKTRWLTLRQRWQGVPVICTTMVQLLNTLFAAPRQNVRRLSALTGSVLLFDEIQALPLRDTCLLNLAMNALAQICRCTIVLCTATQPALEETPYPVEFSPDRDLVADFARRFQQLRRTRIVPRLTPGGEHAPAIADFVTGLLAENRSILVILNTKGAVNKLFDTLQAGLPGDVRLFCLTTRLCHRHREDVMEELKSCLQAKGPPVVCVSTQLMEAGVDLSFDCVVRSMAGLPSIAQAAGRCNRNGEDACRPVYLIRCADEDLRYLPEIDTAAQATQRLLEQLLPGTDLLSPKAIQAYYRIYYGDRDQARRMQYLVTPEGALETTMVQLLSNNRDGVNALRECTGNTVERWMLCQAFGTAEALFEAIPDESVTILVPYGDGAEKLASLLSGRGTAPTLPELQPYAVSISPGECKKLGDAVIPVLDGAALMLQPNFYDRHKGVCFQPLELPPLIL